jgi:F-box-like
MKDTGSLHSLSDLPDNLLIRILEFLPAQRDIYSMCLVSRRINAAADPCLYKSISLDKPQRSPDIFTSLINRPRRGSLIQNVRLEYPTSELSDIMRLKDSPNRIDNFLYAVSTMSNLENLVISVPESLCRGIGTLFSSPFDLACLKSCKSGLYF